MATTRTRQGTDLPLRHCAGGATTRVVFGAGIAGYGGTVAECLAVPGHRCRQNTFRPKGVLHSDFHGGLAGQVADLTVAGVRRGSVEVAYAHDPPVGPGAPFLEEERALLEMVAREISVLVERSETEARNAKLQDQLRHADRLATIGQLGAGVAHEINLPRR